MSPEDKRYKRFLWRLQNKDKIKESNRKYKTKTKEQRRYKYFGDRKCRVCGILLSDLDYGAKRTIHYCRSCRDKGLAQKDSNIRKKQKYNLKQIAHNKFIKERIHPAFRD